MTYTVKVANTDANNRFLSRLPNSPDFLAKLAEQLTLLSKYPYVGEEIEAPIPTRTWGFTINYRTEIYRIVVSYDIDDENKIVNITAFSRTPIL